MRFHLQSQSAIAGPPAALTVPAPAEAATAVALALVIVRCRDGGRRSRVRECSTLKLDHLLFTWIWLPKSIAYCFDFPSSLLHLLPPFPFSDS